MFEEIIDYFIVVEKDDFIFVVELREKFSVVEEFFECLYFVVL